MEKMKECGLDMQGMMKTEAGRRMAQHRHAVMEQFLQEFMQEWDAMT